MALEMTIYREDVLWADRAYCRYESAVGSKFATYDFRPRAGSAASMYMVQVEIVEHVWPRWVSAKVWLQIDGDSSGAWLPVTWFGAPGSDHPTGIVRFPFGVLKPGDTNPSDTVVWSVGFREV